MRQLLPFPLVTGGLFVMWLLLNQAVSVGHLPLGGAVAIAGGWALSVLRLPRVQVRRLSAIFHLASLVSVDIVRSNLAVGKLILGFGRRERTSGFVNIPLDLRNTYGLAALACIITSTPGTLWVSFNPAERKLMIHVLDLIDENDWIHTIKGRYGRLLREIFEWP